MIGPSDPRFANGGDKSERPERIHQALARKLGTAIITGEIAPGASLEGEIEQAEALGVSRTPYREALKILVAKGLLESRPKAGTHVTPRRQWNMLDPDILAWNFAGEPDPRFVNDIFELRGVVEPAAAALAATRRSPAQLAAMTEALADMASHGLASAAGRAADQRFHDEMLNASGNEAMASLSSSIGTAVELTTMFKARVSGQPRDALEEHQAVLNAIAKGNARGARRAMELLISNAHRDMALKP